MAQGGQGVGGFARLADGDDQGARLGHAGAVAVFAGHLHAAGDAGNRLQPVFGGAAAVVAGATRQDEHAVDVFEHAPGSVAIGPIEQLRHDGADAVQGVGDGIGLLKNLFLHVVAVRPQLHRAAEGLHGFHRALLGQQHMAGFIGQPVAARLQIDQIALFQVHDLIGHPGNGHGVAGQEKFIFIAPHAQHQGRTGTRPHHAVRLVLVQHGNGVGPAQFGAGGFDGLEQVAVVQAIDQVADDFGVRLAGKHIALGLQLAAQFLVVFDDAVVYQGDARGHAAARIQAGAVAKVRVGVGHGRCAVRGPAGVGDAGQALKILGLHLRQQLRHPRRAAGALQALADGRATDHAVYGHATGVITPVFQPLQALHQQGHDVAIRDRRDDATHTTIPSKKAKTTQKAHKNRTKTAMCAILEEAKRNKN